MTKRNPATNARPARYVGLRQMLEYRRGQLQTEVRGRVRGIRADAFSRSTFNDVLDAVETSDADVQGHVECALIQMKAETLSRIHDALQRLEHDDYGNCVDCGEEIAEKRLRALPFAVRCLSCEEAQETEQRRRLASEPGRNPVFVGVPLD